MAKAESPIDVARSTLGGALRNGPLRIPSYQREYAWKRERVKKLFDDFNNAMVKQQPSYFLGTVVMTLGEPPSVVDGQQRLATTMIFLAAVRDAMIELGEAKEAKSINDDFLFKYDRDEKDDVPRLSLNTDDRSFIMDRVLAPDAGKRDAASRLHSHRRIDEAARIAKDRVAKIMASADTVARKVDALNAWVHFIDRRAVIVVLTAPSSLRAYQMFKTLNDRAQRTTQADMIKNHLFEHAGENIDEAQSKWSSMRSTIEGLGQSHREDPILEYLHHVSIAFNGPVKADDIFEVMEQRIGSRSASLAFLESLSSYASDYSAIVTPSHAKWGAYDHRVRAAIAVISHELKMSFIRPLMLATSARFSPAEANIAIQQFASWTVRFLIAGGHRSGAVEKAFGEAAHAISNRTITTAAQLTESVRHVIPNDVRFKNAFQVKTMSAGKQARFILRELENQARGGTPDQLVQPVEDTSLLSLEHVLPKNLAAVAGWGHFTNEERKAYRNRLGNMILLDTKDNGAIGDKPFPAKRPIIEKSKNLILTADVISRTTATSQWKVDDIDARQIYLADLALQRWPIDPPAKRKMKRKAGESNPSE